MATTVNSTRMSPNTVNTQPVRGRSKSVYWLIALIVIVAGIFLYSRRSITDVNTLGSTQRTTTTTDTLNTSGAGTAGTATQQTNGNANGIYDPNYDTRPPVGAGTTGGVPGANDFNSPTPMNLPNNAPSSDGTGVRQ